MSAKELLFSIDARKAKSAVRVDQWVGRALVMINYGVLKNRAPLDPAWGSRIPT